MACKDASSRGASASRRGRRRERTAHDPIVESWRRAVKRAAAGMLGRLGCFEKSSARASAHFIPGDRIPCLTPPPPLQKRGFALKRRPDAALGRLGGARRAFRLAWGSAGLSPASRPITLVVKSARLRLQRWLSPLGLELRCAVFGAFFIGYPAFGLDRRVLLGFAGRGRRSFASGRSSGRAVAALILALIEAPRRAGADPSARRWRSHAHSIFFGRGRPFRFCAG